EYESPTAGRILRIIAEAGAVVPVKQTIAYIDAKQTKESATEPPLAVHQESQHRLMANASPNPLIPADDGQHFVARSQASPDARVIASPTVRRRARELNVSLAAIGRGSGPNGRIILNDLNTFLRGDGQSSVSQPASILPPVHTNRRTISKMRRTIASRL